MGTLFRMLQNANKGFTLVELLVYILVVGVIASAVIFLALQLSDVVIKIRTKTEVLSNGRLAMDRMLSEIRYTQSVYTPTSDLISDIGRLSLVSTVGVPSGEKQTYIDFYIVGGRLYMKREGQSSQALTSSRVAITRLKFSQVNVSPTSEGVTIELALRENPRNQRLSQQVDVILQSTVAMRGK